MNHLNEQVRTTKITTYYIMFDMRISEISPCFTDCIVYMSVILAFSVKAVALIFMSYYLTVSFESIFVVLEVERQKINPLV